MAPRDDRRPGPGRPPVRSNNLDGTSLRNARASLVDVGFAAIEEALWSRHGQLASNVGSRRSSPPTLWAVELADRADEVERYDVYRGDRATSAPR
jgi:hypothetical protein